MYPIKKYSTFVKMINEGLIMTHDIDSAVGILEVYLNSLTGLFYNINKLSNNRFEIEFENFKDLYSNILSNCNVLGYFPSYMWITYFDHIENSKYNFEKIKKNEENIKKIKLRFESKFDEPVKTYYPVIYHVCKEVNLKKIKEIGLVAKSKNRISTHPERLYFALDESSANLVYQNFVYNDNFNKRKIIYYLLKIKNDGYKLYKDPNFYNVGCYTYDNIKKEDIIDTIKL